jgi:hypothetical protein
MVVPVALRGQARGVERALLKMIKKALKRKPFLSDCPLFQWFTIPF